MTTLGRGCWGGGDFGMVVVAGVPAVERRGDAMVETVNVLNEFVKTGPAALSK